MHIYIHKHIHIYMYISLPSLLSLSSPSPSSSSIGLLISDPQIFTDPEKFVYLWVHESERVYGEDSIIVYMYTSAYAYLYNYEYTHEYICLFVVSICLFFHQFFNISIPQEID
jgi:hypothetical protein